MDQPEVLSERPENADFGIHIDFRKDSENPARVFQAATGLIQAFDLLNNVLVRSVDTQISPVLALEDIEAGSLRVWFRHLLKSVPDDAIKNLDWRRAVGAYLVKGKYRILKFMADRDTVSDRRELLSYA